MFERALVFALWPALFASAATVRSSDEPIAVRRDADFLNVLKPCDMVWDRVPARWEEGAFVGNGLAGVMVYGQNNALRFDLGRSDVFDHRPVPAGPHPLVAAYLHGRLPIGHFLLTPEGTLTGCHLRLDLFNAEVTGQLTTDRGTIDLRFLAPAGEGAGVLLDATPHGGETGVHLQWQGEESVSPRYSYSITYRLKPKHQSVEKWLHEQHLEDYHANPPATAGETGGVKWSSQPMSAGGAYVTAWEEQTLGPTHAFTLAEGYSQESEAAAKDDALAGLEVGRGERRTAAVEAHRRWWHAYWPESFISVPDDRMTQFYWLQQYKFASASRAGRPALDLYGPWFPKTAWPYYCWNMNVQVAYSPVPASNRLELGQNLGDFLFAHEDALRANTHLPDAAAIGRATSQDATGDMDNEWGDLPWALHNVYRQYRFAGDDDAIVQRLYPLLRQAMNFYLAALKPDDQGALHLPETFSPEYGVAPDCNYDLSLLRWGLGVLLTYADKAHAPADQRQHWADVLSHLAAYPADDDGLMIGRGVPLAKAHRHFSHLLMIYPLRTLTPDAPADRALIEKSLHHWMTVPGPDRLGFTFVGAASISATLGDGDYAQQMLNALLDRTIFPNTMYVEGCIESPLGWCDALQNLLLESDDRGVMVFPAVPRDWKDVAFDDLRAQGAFLVSAARSGGNTSWVRVKSLKGEPLTIRPGLADDAKYKSDDPGVQVTRNGAEYKVTLATGKSIVFHAGDAPPEWVVQAKEGDPAQANRYGLREGVTRKK